MTKIIVGKSSYDWKRHSWLKNVRKSSGCRTTLLLRAAASKIHRTCPNNIQPPIEVTLKYLPLFLSTKVPSAKRARESFEEKTSGIIVELTSQSVDFFSIWNVFDVAFLQKTSQSRCKTFNPYNRSKRDRGWVFLCKQKRRTYTNM